MPPQLKREQKRDGRRDEEGRAEQIELVRAVVARQRLQAAIGDGKRREARGAG